MTQEVPDTDPSMRSRFTSEGPQAQGLAATPYRVALQILEENAEIIRLALRPNSNDPITELEIPTLSSGSLRSPVRAGSSADQLRKYHAGIFIAELARHAKTVNHPNLGLTLDFGHLFSAANYCSFDFLEAIR